MFMYSLLKSLKILEKISTALCVQYSLTIASSSQLPQILTIFLKGGENDMKRIYLFVSLRL